MRAEVRGTASGSGKGTFKERGISLVYSVSMVRVREYSRGKYHCTVDLRFDWFGLVCFANKNKKCHLSYN